MSSRAADRVFRRAMPRDICRSARTTQEVEVVGGAEAVMSGRAADRVFRRAMSRDICRGARTTQKNLTQQAAGRLS
jgi:hypothetical protein